MKPGLIFDIDGCLTLPFEKENPISILDRELLSSILTLYQQDIPVIFVTGRSTNFYFSEFEALKLKDIFQIPAYLEFGLVYSRNKEVDIRYSSQMFTSTKEEYYNQFREEAVSNGIKIAEGEHDTYPQTGEAWFEKKYVMGSVISNKLVKPSEIWKIGMKISPYYSGKLRILTHALGIDILPHGWSKAEAVKEYAKDFNSSYRWYVFGDNDADREMALALPSSDFTSTSLNGSLDVRKKLSTLGLI